MPVSVSKRIQRWHWGKVVILWSWGGAIVAVLLTRFLSQEASIDPTVSSLSFLGSLVIVAILTIATWVWLGGKETQTLNGSNGGSAADQNME